MTKQEWQTKYGLDNEDMEKVCFIKELFNGTIIHVYENININIPIYLRK